MSRGFKVFLVVLVGWSCMGVTGFVLDERAAAKAAAESIDTAYTWRSPEGLWRYRVAEFERLLAEKPASDFERLFIRDVLDMAKEGYRLGRVDEATDCAVRMVEDLGDQGTQEQRSGRR